MVEILKTTHQDMVERSEHFEPLLGGLIEGETGLVVLNKLLLSQNLVYAVVDDVIVATYGYGLVEEGNPCLIPELLSRINSDDVLVYVNNIWVRNGYTGMGLTAQLKDAYTEFAIESGATHSVGYLPQTEKIRQWADQLKDITIIRPNPQSGVDWITLRELASTRGA